MFTRFFAVAPLLLLALVGGPLSASAPTAVPTDERAVLHALSRLTFGPRPGDAARVKSMGLGAWIELQLVPSRIDDSALTARLAQFETLGLDSHTIVTEYAGPAMQERRQRQLAQSKNGTTNPEMLPGSQLPAPGSRQMTDAMRKDREVIADLEQAKLLRAVYSERQLEEVLVDFWFNHFNVFAGKGATRNYVGEYEREAIRPFVFGSFRDMLEATAKSPAMLFYLDNWQSATPGAQATPRRPRSAAGATPARAARPRGINENYARELMELHTLGVDGGYTQKDIIEVARAFTGWTIRPRQGSGFLFASPMHDNGEKKVLGHVIKAGGGVSDGLQVLDILAAHPATAHFIALKLATRFVSDSPPPALVERAAARFTATRGNLREVVRTIITSPEFFAPETYRAKVKTPLEFVASAVRTTGADVRNALPLARELRDQGMPLYFCQPPTGYDDTASTWVSSGALVSRMNFAVKLGENTLPGVRLPSADKQLAVTIGSPDFQKR
jgi:uncharacterized protein (DUF1800 family)